MYPDPTLTLADQMRMIADLFLRILGPEVPTSWPAKRSRMSPQTPRFIDLIYTTLRLHSALCYLIPA